MSWKGWFLGVFGPPGRGRPNGTARTGWGEKKKRKARRPVSRVLSTPRGDRWPFIWDARYRTPRATYPGGGTETRLPEKLRRAAPTWSCSRWGLPCHPRCRGRGALLPHPFTLTPPKNRWGPKVPFLPPKRAVLWRGGLLSVALSLGSPPPAVNRHRVSVEPGLSSPRGFPHCERRPSGRLAGLKLALPAERSSVAQIEQRLEPAQGFGTGPAINGFGTKMALKGGYRLGPIGAVVTVLREPFQHLSLAHFAGSSFHGFRIADLSLKSPDQL